MKRPTSVELDDFVEGWVGPQFVTTVTYGGYANDSEFVTIRHDDDDYGDYGFSMTRKEARQLRNFLNKCLEW
jgi:hypothetical protein